MAGDKRTNLTDSTPTRNQRLTDGILWAIVGAYLVGSRIIPGFITPLLFPFALIHGARRYGWKGIAVFMVVTLIVSNVLENSSILTGFPFGTYYYTDSLGPKIALVPFFISLYPTSRSAILPGLLYRPGRRSPPELYSPHYNRGLTCRLVRNG